LVTLQKAGSINQLKKARIWFTFLIHSRIDYIKANTLSQLTSSEIISDQPDLVGDEKYDEKHDVLDPG